MSSPQKLLKGQGYKISLTYDLHPPALGDGVEEGGLSTHLTPTSITLSFIQYPVLRIQIRPDPS